MARKKAVRKSRMDLLLESMDAAGQGKAVAPITAAAFLAQSSSDDDNDDDFSLAALSPSSPTMPSPRPNGPAPQKGRRLERNNSLANASLDSMSTSPLFTSELGLRQRKRDKDIENILYEAEAVGTSKGSHALCSLIRMLGREDDSQQEGISMTNAKKMLSLIRTSGASMTNLVESLTHPFSKRSGAASDDVLKGHLSFLRFVLGQCSAETLTRQSVYLFVLDLLRLSVGPSVTHSESPEAPKTKVNRSHWSLLIRPEIADPSPAGTAEDAGELMACLAPLIAPSSIDDLKARSLTSVASEVMTMILIAGNQQSLFGSGAGASGYLESQASDLSDFGISLFSDEAEPTSASLQFARMSGFKVCLGALTAVPPLDADSCHSVLSLMEVATCSEALKANEEVTSIFADILDYMLDNLSTEGNASYCMRIAINVSGLCKNAISEEEGPCSQYTARLSSALLEATAGNDLTTIDTGGLCEVICLAINLCKRGSNDAFRWSLMKEMDGRLCEWAAQWLQTFYSIDGDASSNILAGYIALLLAMLSLRDPRARVRVVTALKTHASTSIAKVVSKPMTWVVAVLQEFLLFQSSVEILTKDMVVALHSVIDAVIDENGIAVSK